MIAAYRDVGSMNPHEPQLTLDSVHRFAVDLHGVIANIATAFAGYERLQKRAARLGLPADVAPPLPMTSADLAPIASAIKDLAKVAGQQAKQARGRITLC